MKFRIHYKDCDIKDNLVVEGKTIKECQKLIHKELNKRGWDKDKCWSDKI